ncbi:hypothetical protein SprV_0301114300 [Sparganum proliferum]
MFVRCNRVCKPLEPPYEGPFCVHSRNGDKEDVVSIDRVKVVVGEELPDLPQGKNCSDPLPRAPPPPLPYAPPS